MAATGVTLTTAKSPPVVVDKLPAPRWLFVDFLEHVYNGKPATLPLADMYRVCEITLAADEAAVSGRIIVIL